VGSGVESVIERLGRAARQTLCTINDECAAQSILRYGWRAWPRDTTVGQSGNFNAAATHRTRPLMSRLTTGSTIVHYDNRHHVCRCAPMLDCPGHGSRPCKNWPRYSRLPRKLHPPADCQANIKPAVQQKPLVHLLTFGAAVVRPLPLRDLRRPLSPLRLKCTSLTKSLSFVKCQQRAAWRAWRSFLNESVPSMI